MQNPYRRVYGVFFSFLRVLPRQRPVLPVWVWRIWSGISDKLAAAAADAESAAFSTRSHGVSMCVLGVMCRRARCLLP